VLIEPLVRQFATHSSLSTFSKGAVQPAHTWL